MNSLITKYKTDTLTPAELEDFRAAMAEASDDELSGALLDSWQRDDLSACASGEESLTEVKSRIDARLGIRPRLGFWRIAAAAAAAVLLPALIIAALMLRTSQPDAARLAFATGGGQASLTLPDGTRAELAPRTRLQFTAAKRGSGSERTVDFDGEARFRVAKDASHPFVISGSGMRVRVLGTTFNLRLRQGASTSELALAEGSVELTATANGRKVRLTPMHKATLDRRTGEFEIEAVADSADIASWRHGVLTFKNRPLAEVLERLEENYGVKLVSEGKPAGRFTGTLPADNLDQALKIVRLTLRLRELRIRN